MSCKVCNVPGDLHAPPVPGNHRYQVADGIAAITLSRSHKLNAYSAQMRVELSLLFDQTDRMQDFPERVIWPGLCISLTVLSVNYIGDGLRDALDPRIRGR